MPITTPDPNPDPNVEGDPPESGVNDVTEQDDTEEATDQGPLADPEGDEDK